MGELAGGRSWGSRGSWGVLWVSFLEGRAILVSKLLKNIGFWTSILWIIGEKAGEGLGDAKGSWGSWGILGVIFLGVRGSLLVPNPLKRIFLD